MSRPAMQAGWGEKHYDSHLITRSIKISSNQIRVQWRHRLNAFCARREFLTGSDSSLKTTTFGTVRKPRPCSVQTYQQGGLLFCGGHFYDCVGRSRDEVDSFVVTKSCRSL